jgi:hypothetical protein
MTSISALGKSVDAKQSVAKSVRDCPALRTLQKWYNPIICGAQSIEIAQIVLYVSKLGEIPLKEKISNRFSSMISSIQLYEGNRWGFFTACQTS